MTAIDHTEHRVGSRVRAARSAQRFRTRQHAAGDDTDAQVHRRRRIQRRTVVAIITFGVPRSDAADEGASEDLPYVGDFWLPLENTSHLLKPEGHLGVLVKGVVDRVHEVIDELFERW